MFSVGCNNVYGGRLRVIVVVVGGGLRQGRFGGGLRQGRFGGGVVVCCGKVQAWLGAVEACLDEGQYLGGGEARLLNGQVYLGGVDEVQFDKVPDVIGNYDICIVKSMRLCSSIISCAKRMKLIMQYGVGLEGVDVNAATDNGVKVARISGANTGNAASCAEMAIYLMLGLLRKQNEMQNAVKQKKVGEPVGETLLGKKG
ncbi:hypothetical protein RJ639_046978 [Escallonia herrerae]|uniref:D-isomer specific 2-hydroxyacid dehydrogenase catalytic domain-containing protein n=1 Tax=Escallonia herrerae TaxID=1293975 RepID=A0AA88W5Z1_9ASTE|nr:hypothetical protein RJ639_046978 [Escallonia herrerae]